MTAGWIMSTIAGCHVHGSHDQNFLQNESVPLGGIALVSEVETKRTQIDIWHGRPERTAKQHHMGLFVDPDLCGNIAKDGFLLGKGNFGIAFCGATVRWLVAICLTFGPKPKLVMDSSVVA